MALVNAVNVSGLVDPEACSGLASDLDMENAGPTCKSPAMKLRRSCYTT